MQLPQLQDKDTKSPSYTGTLQRTIRKTQTSASRTTRILPRLMADRLVVQVELSAPTSQHIGSEYWWSLSLRWRGNTIWLPLRIVRTSTQTLRLLNTVNPSSAQTLLWICKDSRCNSQQTASTTQTVSSISQSSFYLRLALIARRTHQEFSLPTAAFLTPKSYTEETSH